MKSILIRLALIFAVAPYHVDAAGPSRFERVALKQYDESCLIGGLSVSECTTALKRIHTKMYRYAWLSPPSKDVVRQTLTDAGKYSASRSNFVIFASKLLQQRVAVRSVAGTIIPWLILRYLLDSGTHLSFKKTLPLETAFADFLETLVNGSIGIFTGKGTSVALPLFSLPEAALLLFGAFNLVNGILAFVSAQTFLSQESSRKNTLPSVLTNIIPVQSDTASDNALAIFSTVAALGAAGVVAAMTSNQDARQSSLLNLVPVDSATSKKPVVKKLPKKPRQPRRKAAPPRKKKRPSPPKKQGIPPPPKKVVRPQHKKRVVRPPPKTKVVPPPKKKIVPPPKQKVVPPPKTKVVPPSKQKVVPPPKKKVVSRPKKKKFVPPPPSTPPPAPKPRKKVVSRPKKKKQFVPPPPRTSPAPKKRRGKEDETTKNVKKVVTGGAVAIGAKYVLDLLVFNYL